MAENSDQQLPPELAKKRATINLWITVLSPFLLLGIGVGWAALDIGLDNVYVGAVCLFFAIVGIVPLAFGFLIALKWKTVHPAGYFFIGLGMSAAVGCIWAACVYGYCTGF